MCGVYSLSAVPEDVAELLGCENVPEEGLRDFIAPGSAIAICRRAGEGREAVMVRWGLVPSWAKEVGTGKPLINARAESVLDKPSFRDAMRRRRCLVPASVFYEWHGDAPGRKQAYSVARSGGATLFAMAGLWETWRSPDGDVLESAAIVTTAANDRLSEIHPRMPAVILEQDFAAWLDTESVSATEATRLLNRAGGAFFAPEPVDLSRPKRAAGREPAAQSDQLSLL
ncbi:SOS response-associated peptidase [Kaustia mangrovi]|uniref:Abasic site processing protein n=1 Tax=Kaustia mangrovi TaxID=2593653 RepID=A0A7S8C2B8_9HYPH|nr:SOS response-associated peptidase [Kaustia mangrovi]QPC42081.1 SOS response-associated peptidase [Kaustia mangrovi]